MRKNQKSLKSIIAMLLVFSMVITCGPSTIIANAETLATKLTTEDKQGVILHAWNWSFNTVTANLDAIKAAGYTEIQVSPIQINKDLGGAYTTSDKWWILYQPSGFRIGNKQLGTEDEFKEMCAAAHGKGLKIIVDTIVNHMGNNGDANFPAAEVDDNISFTKHQDFWHTDANGKLHVITDYNNRYDVTHNGVGLPDLNTGNPDLQGIIKQYLQKCLNDGADGFRFDTAKHVELPTDTEKDVASTFWPSVLSDLKLIDGSKPYVYGEVLQGGADNLLGYSKYFDTTASKYGTDIRNTVGIGVGSGINLSKNFDTLKTYDVPTGIVGSDLVTWVESHDTYANESEESTAMTDEQIKNGWGIVASRADSTPLYFNRPAGRKKLQGNMGDAGNDNWKDPDVVAVNKFHSVMDGQGETLTKLSDNVIMIERGTKGVVFVNLGTDPYTLADKTINLANGTYTNYATTGGTFDVLSGKITGIISKGITVLYAGGTQETAVITPKVSIDKEDCSFVDYLDLILNVENGATTKYSIDGDDKGSFTEGQSLRIGENATPGTKITVKVSGTSSDGKTVSETYTYMKRDPSAKATVYFTKPAGWQIPYAYVYNTLGEKYNNAAFPGNKMEKIGANLYKYEIDGFTDGEVIFNDWFYGNHKTSALEIASNGMKLYDDKGVWNNTTEITKDPSVTDDVVTDGTSKVYFQKPDTSEWNYDDVNIYFYGKGGPNWPGVTMTKVDGSTNLYSFSLPAGLEGSNVIFNVNGGKMQVPGSGESGLTAPANSKMIYVDGVWKEYVEAGTSKIYFRKPSDWAEPNVYAYKIDGNVGSKVTAEVNEWPGVPMEKVDGTETLYSYTFSKDCQNINVIFNDKVKDKDGGNQFPDKDAYQLFVGEVKIYDNQGLRNFTADDLKEPEAPAVASQGITKVYFEKPADWNNVKIHYWQEGGSSTEWPGVSMVDEGNNLYSYNLPEGYESATVIFNNDDKGKQTKNLATKVGSTMEFVTDGTEADGKLTGELVSKAKVYFKNTKGWKSVKVHYWPEGGTGTDWPGASMVDEGDNLYSYTLPDGFENVNVIFNNNDKGEQADTVISEGGKTLILVDSDWREFTATDIPKSDNGTDPEKPTDPGDNQEVGSTVYVKVPNGWNGIPNLHYWNAAGGATTWPGNPMKGEGNGIYSGVIPKSFGDSTIIINDGSNKIADKDGKTEFDVKLGSSIIFEDGEWKEYEEPTDPEEPETSKTPTVNGSINTKTTKVTGTAGANADVILSVDYVTQTTTSAGAEVKTITTTEQKEIASTKADDNGNWSAKIPVQGRGTVINVTAKEDGKLEVSIKVTVKKKSSSRSSSSSSSSSNNTVNVSGNTTTIKSTNSATIVKAITDSTTPNIKIEVSSNSIINKSVFEAIESNPNKTFTFVGDNASWTFSGSDILAIGIADVDTTIKSVSQNSALIANLIGGREIVSLSFAHKGILPGKAIIQASVDSKYNDKTMYMYSYNLANNRLTLVSPSVVVKNGIATFEVAKGSDYILSETAIEGAVKEGWNQKTDGNWILVKEENNVTGWIKYGTEWYYLNQLGIMQRGWLNDNGTWYYLNESGAMKTGWLNDNGVWYYLNESGAMLLNTSVDGYTLGDNGAWI